jgi:hypothetical protein
MRDVRAGDRLKEASAVEREQRGFRRTRRDTPKRSAIHPGILRKSPHVAAEKAMDRVGTCGGLRAVGNRRLMSGAMSFEPTVTEQELLAETFRRREARMTRRKLGASRGRKAGGLTPGEIARPPAPTRKVSAHDTRSSDSQGLQGRCGRHWHACDRDRKCLGRVGQDGPDRRRRRVSAPTLTQPFTSAGDTNSYAPLPGESWNERVHGYRLDAERRRQGRLGDARGRHHGHRPRSPVRSQAVSPATCLTNDHPSARGQIRSVSGTGGVAVTVTSLGTKQQSAGFMPSTSSAWTLASPVNLNPSTVSGWQLAQFTFTTPGTGEYQISNFYVDPKMRH